MKHIECKIYNAYVISIWLWMNGLVYVENNGRSVIGWCVDWSASASQCARFSQRGWYTHVQVQRYQEYALWNVLKPVGEPFAAETLRKIRNICSVKLAYFANNCQQLQWTDCCVSVSFIIQCVRQWLLCYVSCCVNIQKLLNNYPGNLFLYMYILHMSFHCQIYCKLVIIYRYDFTS